MATQVKKPLAECPNSINGFHQYQVYGNYSEYCYICGQPNPEVMDWKHRQVAAMGQKTPFNEKHPYIAAGVWTGVDYRRYQASPNQKRRITK